MSLQIASQILVLGFNFSLDTVNLNNNRIHDIYEIFILFLLFQELCSPASRDGGSRFTIVFSTKQEFPSIFFLPSIFMLTI